MSAREPSAACVHEEDANAGLSGEGLCRKCGAIIASRGKLPIIGYDVQLIGELSSVLHKAAARHYLTTDPSDTRRGQTFEVALPDSRFARVTVELDRVDPDLAEKIAREQAS